MLKRSLYTLQKMFSYRKGLRDFYKNPSNSFAEVVDIDISALKNSGLRSIALDFDGVLAFHGAKEPLAKVNTWLQQLVATFGAENIYILSNKPTLERLNFFSKNYPGISFISGVRKKPYPDGLQKILKQADSMPEQLTLIDDRLLTGVLAALIANVRPIYISKAYTNYRNDFFAELFFVSLRKAERWLLHTFLR